MKTKQTEQAWTARFDAKQKARRISGMTTFEANRLVHALRERDTARANAQRLADALKKLRDGWEGNLTEPMVEAMEALARWEEAQ